MQFELLRLSVLPRPQVDGFERKKADGSSFTREEWLRAVFSGRVDFQHRTEVFRYAPGLEESDQEPIFGRIGRKVSVTENDPQENLKEVEHEAWHAARVIIDPKHHKDGQKAAVEQKYSIGKPIALFESLVAKINAGTEPYFLEAHAIVPTDSFWNFVNKNQGQVVSVEFEFVAPNMFGGADDYEKELREMQSQERIQKAKLTIEGKDGLNLNTDKVKAAANYTSRGTGSIKARTKTKKSYNSKSKAEKITVDNKKIADLPAKDLLKTLFSLIFKP